MATLTSFFLALSIQFLFLNLSIYYKMKNHFLQINPLILDNKHRNRKKEIKTLVTFVKFSEEVGEYVALI